MVIIQNTTPSIGCTSMVVAVVAVAVDFQTRETTLLHYHIAAWAVLLHVVTLPYGVTRALMAVRAGEVA